MTWTKIGDEFGDQCWKLSDAAFRLHTEALVWSNRKHLDGRLDKDEMRLWAKRPEAADTLVGLGWWEDHGDHYQIVSHLGWQRTAAQWLHQSEVNKANQARRKTKRGKNSAKPSDESSDGSSDKPPIGNVSDKDGSSDRPPNNGSFNDSFNDSFNERDWTGQDRTGLLQEGVQQNGSVQNESGSPSLHCKFCSTELQPDQRNRGYCSADECLSEAW